MYFKETEYYDFEEMELVIPKNGGGPFIRVHERNPLSSHYVDFNLEEVLENLWIVYQRRREFGFC